MNSFKVLLNSFLIVFTLATFIDYQSLHATNLNSSLTVDNGYHIYISANENEEGAEFGSADNWVNIKSFSTILTPGVTHYLHIYAYDQGWIAGFLGDFTISDTNFKFANGTQRLLTNTSDWRVYRNSFGGFPDTVTSLGANGVGPWGVISNIASNAEWIWTPDADGDNAAYFSTTITPSGPVIESSIPANGSNTAKTVSSVSITFKSDDADVDLTTSMQGATVRNTAGQTISGSWTISGARTLIFTPSAPFPPDTYTVTLQAVDTLGHSLQQKIVFTNHDTIPPSTSITLTGEKDSAGWYSKPVTITLTADDTNDGSGIAKLEYSLDSGITWQTYTTPFVIDQDGITSIQYRATDKVGNVEAIKSREIKINKSGLVGWWKMDGDWKDSSIIGNDGAPYNGASFSVKTMSGSGSGSFNGLNSYVSIPNSPTLHADRNLTIAGWFYINDFDRRWNSIVWKGNDPDCTANCENREYGIWVNSAGFMQFSSTPVDMVGIGTLSLVTPNGTIQSGEWHYFSAVVSSDQGTMRLYIDGMERATTSYSSSGIRTSTAPLLFGVTSSIGRDYLNGLLDDIRIYNRALSSAEIVELFKNNLSIGTPTLDPVTSPTDKANITLTGTKPIGSSIVINGQMRVTLNDAANWSCNYPLTEGNNTLLITARDAAGKGSAPISPAPVITLDTTPPVFTIDIYKNPATSAKQALSGGKEPGCIVKLNGVLLFDASDRNVTWSHDITLVDGMTNHLVFTATDSIGNTITKNLDILFDSTPPAALGAGMLTVDGGGKGTEVTLSWPSYPEPATLAYYRIYQSTTGFTTTATLTPIDTVSKGIKSYKVTGLAQGTGYFFAVVPVSSSGSSDPSVHTASAIPADTVAPEDITGLSATAGYSAADGNSVTLFWSASANTSNDLADQILYIDDGKGYDSGVSIGNSVVGFTKKGLNDATIYKFKITTKDILNQESTGTIVQAVTRLDNPTGLTVLPGNGKAVLNWQPVSSPYVKSYNIYRVKSGNSQTDVTAMSLIKSQTTVGFTDTTLTNDAVYQYAVTVVNISDAERTSVQSVAVTPRGDTTGPVISGLNLTANKVFTAPFTITATATDESALDRIELYVDDVKTATVNGGTFSWNWNVADTTDGNHIVKIAAYDTPGNKSEAGIPVVVSLAAPPVPIITTSFDAPISRKSVSISGVNQAGATVSLRLNGVVTAQQTTSGSTFTFSEVNLAEGDNHISVKAANRGGESPYSADLKITVITTTPSAPIELSAKQLAGGSLQFSWKPGPTGAAVGYNLYESLTPFNSPTDPGVEKINSGLITYLFKEQIPADDTLRYYAVTTVDGAGNESSISNVVSIASDRLAPTATVTFTAGDGTVPAGNTHGPGSLTIALTVSEPLKETPFLSLEPQSGSPVVVVMRKTDDTHYSAGLTIDATLPHGATIWKFSGKDMAGNRGNNQGSGPILDLKGPQASVTAPLNLLKSSDGPVMVSVTLDEASTITPVMILTAPDGSSAPVSDLTSSDNIHWNGSLDPAALGEGNGRFVLTDSRDRFKNRGTDVISGANITIYKTAPPPPSVPMGLTAKAFKGGEVRLAWMPVSDAQGYNIYRQGAVDAAPFKITTLSGFNTITYSETVTSDGSYAYSVSSIGLLNAESAQSPTVSVLTDATPPPIPAALILTMTGNGIKAEWQAGIGEAPSFYRLYRAASPINDITSLTPVATVKELTAIDPSPDHAKRFYAVTSLDRIGNESTPSGAPEITFPVIPVRNLTVSRVDDGKPAIFWEAGESDLLGYYIYRNGSKVNQTPTISTTFSDSYHAGGSVTYGVSAVSSLGVESPIREATLPELSIGLKEGTLLRRGVLENIVLTATQPQGASIPVTLDAVAIKIGALPESAASGPFIIPVDKPLEITKVAATEANTPPQTAVVVTAIMTPVPGVTVKIIRSVLAGVIASGAPLEIFNEPLVRGTQAKVRIKVTNTGSARMEFVSSENEESSSQSKVILLDQDRNILAQGRLAQRAGSRIVDSGSYATVRLEPGESFLSDPITLGVPANAPYRISLEAVIDNIWYHYKQTDQVMAPGLQTSLDGSIADVSYMAVARTDKSVYKQGENVVITGSATSTSDSKPMTNVPVKIGVSVKGFDRFATVNTDANGNFSYTFTPGVSEAGSYSVWAIHPDLSNRTVQSQFSIIGLQVSPLQANIRLLKGQSYDIPVTLANLGGSPLTGLNFSPTTSSGVTGTAVNIGNPVLNPGESRNITFRVGADQGASASGFASLDITTQEGLTSRVDASITTISAIPVITTSPSYIDTGLMRGNQRIENIVIKNTGAETLVNPRIEGPSLSWLALTVDKNIGDIPAGQSRTFGILIKPGEILAQGVYDDRIVIQSDNHIPYTFNIQVTVTSSAVGNVQFSVLNELMKDVSGAKITFQNQSLLDFIQTVTTDSSGTATIFDLPEGRYSYNISAPGAQPTSGSFVIAPGMTTSVPIALELSLVKIEWSVTPVVIEDRYDIQISQTFETNVPTPVLVIEPAGINIPDMQPGLAFNGEFTVSNYGLIALDNVSVNFPSSIDDYDIELMVSTIPKTLSAMQKVTVPYRIIRRVSTTYLPTNIYDEITSFGGGTCYTSRPLYTIKGTAVICPDTPQQKTVEKNATFYGNFPYTCGTTTTGGPTSVVSSGGSISGSSVGVESYTQGIGGAGIPVVTPLPSNEPCSCKPDNTPCPSDGNLCTDDFCDRGTCIHFPNSIKLLDMNIGNCKDKVCGDGVLIDKINDSNKPINGCKDCSGGNVVNLANGIVSRDSTKCCYDGEQLPKHRVVDLDKCPSRVPNPIWIKVFDGCTNVPNNPTGGYDTHFSNTNHTGPCDNHDRCYQTCANDLYAGQLACDEGMYVDMLDICDGSIEDDKTKNECRNWAYIYYVGLRTFGSQFYKQRQKEVCYCCN